LRQRADDLPLLARRIANGLGHDIDFTSDAIRAMQAYDWPGNVRELRNVIERALILEDADKITTEYLPGGLLTPGRPAPSSTAGTTETQFVLPDEGISLDEAELSFVRQAIQRSGGNQTRAAELLGISRDQLRYRLKKLEEAEVSSPEV